MTIEAALRATEILLAFALMQASLEHFSLGQHRVLFTFRGGLCLLLASGAAPALTCAALWPTSLILLHRFDGAYNGGSDKMGLLTLTCLTLAHLIPEAAELALAYLGVQLTLSYAVSGWIKLRDPNWRRGTALQDVFLFSAYPQSLAIRGLAQRQTLLRIGSATVIALEVLFPLSLLHPITLAIALSLTALFHLANALLFGLNRFLWHWLAAYPSLLWLQDRLLG